uniref:Plethodontid modulating factor n=1 Tax=Plethodon richmondi TaxID=154588 RepID=Q0GAD6_9SALA|nr:plethodontid modulating factor [Plethodon richmondi]
MRTTALLILLVVLVSTGEALKCNTLNGGIVQCSGNGQACVHFKDKEDEFKSCWAKEDCRDTERDASGRTIYLCCTEDLCN